MACIREYPRGGGGDYGIEQDTKHDTHYQVYQVNVFK